MRSVTPITTLCQTTSQPIPTPLQVSFDAPERVAKARQEQQPPAATSQPDPQAAAQPASASTTLAPSADCGDAVATEGDSAGSCVVEYVVDEAHVASCMDGLLQKQDLSKYVL